MSEETEKFKADFDAITNEIEKVIVGYKDIVRNILIAFFSDGHILLEGVPGLGKTLLIKTFSQVLGFEFKRIQFTPDLMPADILGTQLIVDKEGGGKDFKFVQGPIFANIILADEINRATPRTQSALLESMEEKQVTIAGSTTKLKDPFFVMATQNPIEMEGTYPIPEAQLDRFFFKLNALSPGLASLKKILNRTTSSAHYTAKSVLEPELASGRVMEMKALVRDVMVSSDIEDFIVRFIISTHPEQNISNFHNEINDPTNQKNLKTEFATKFISYGASPRGGQAIVLGAKVMALLDGRVSVSYEDVEKVAIPALNHRLVLNFEAEAENIKGEDIIKNILQELER